jgi:Flp pilus assembly pilin Flp
MGEAAEAFVYFLKDENAATAIEYRQIAAGVALAILLRRSRASARN